MKINIQNLEHDLIEVDGDLVTTIPDREMRRFYPETSRVHVVLDRFGKDYRVDVNVKTIAHYICDRCLTGFTQTVTIDQRQVYHVGECEIDDQDIINLPANAIEIDLAPVIEEMIRLNHPIKMLCREDCKGICPNCGADLNNEECRCTGEPIDPRWTQLRKLIR